MWWFEWLHYYSIYVARIPRASRFRDAPLDAIMRSGARHAARAQRCATAPRGGLVESLGYRCVVKMVLQKNKL